MLLKVFLACCVGDCEDDEWGWLLGVGLVLTPCPYPGLCIHVVACREGVYDGDCWVLQQFGVGTGLAFREGKYRTGGAGMFWQFCLCCTHHGPSDCLLHFFVIVLWVCQAGSIPWSGVCIPLCPKELVLFKF